MTYLVYAFGSNGSGQLALGHAEDVKVPQQCKFEEDLVSRPVKVAAGGNHTLLLCENGTLFVAGDTGGGRCAVEPSEHLTIFRRVKLKANNGNMVEKFLFCSATWEASTIIAADGDVYTCGFGLKGELGHGDSESCCNSPKLLPDFPPSGTIVVDLAACMSHTVAVLSNGDVYGWGAGRQGQLDQPAETVWVPKKIEGILFPVIHASCGKEFTYLLGSAVSGAHTVLGSDKWNVKTSAPMSVKYWRAAQASWGGIHVLFDDGTVVAWGRNDHGQHAPKELAPLRHIAVGSEHTMANDGNGRILAWGWGEHGNCGDMSAANETGMTFNIVTTDLPMFVLGAGCATSWLYCETTP